MEDFVVELGEVLWIKDDVSERYNAPECGGCEAMNNVAVIGILDKEEYAYPYVVIPYSSCNKHSLWELPYRYIIHSDVYAVFEDNYEDPLPYYLKRRDFLESSGCIDRELSVTHIGPDGEMWQEEPAEQRDEMSLDTFWNALSNTHT